MNNMRIGRLATGSLGTLLLSIWLIATAVLLLAKVSIPNAALLLAVLAIAAGALLLVRSGGLTANLGTLLLSIWLIASGLLIVAKINVANQGMLLAVLAVAAGILLLMTEAGLNVSRTAGQRIKHAVRSRGGMALNLGWLLLAIWLVVQGAMILLKFSFTNSGIIMAVVALAAGVLILLRR
jgi:hypothetical protein